MEQITVSRNDAGKRLDIVLSNRLPDVSRSRIQRLIAEEKVTLNNAPVAKRHTVAPGDIISITASSITGKTTASPVPQNIPLEILHEDEHLLVVNKPAGLVVHPGNGNRDNTLVNALLYRDNSLSDGFSRERPGIVHRLDKETSGVLLVAKTNTVHHRLASAFMNRTVKKQYLGICIGMPAEPDGRIELSLDRNRREPVKRAVSSRGKQATTDYSLIRHRCGISIIRFSPHTGRTHQIRVHASASGFPICADTLYDGGRERILRIDPVNRPFAYSIHKCFTRPRHALHASSITLTHPVENNVITIHAPLPDDFMNVIRLFDDRDLLTELEQL
jgi:23S rRNA pseudouridine1911/1915/1917 synthase